jgi:hypothetical protein
VTYTLQWKFRQKMVRSRALHEDPPRVLLVDNFKEDYKVPQFQTPSSCAVVIVGRRICRTSCELMGTAAEGRAVICSVTFLCTPKVTLNGLYTNKDPLRPYKVEATILAH